MNPEQNTTVQQTSANDYFLDEQPSPNDRYKKQFGSLFTAGKYYFVKALPFAVSVINTILFYAFRFIRGAFQSVMEQLK